MENAVAKGIGNVPQALKDKPEAYYDLEPYIGAFFVLSRSRSYGNGPNPIPISEMLVYADIFCFEDKEEFIAYMQAADDEFIGYSTEKLKNGGP